MKSSLLLLLALPILNTPARASDVDLVRAGCDAISVVPQRAACHAAVVRLAKTSSPKSPTSRRSDADAPGAASITAAKNRVLTLLNDPESARFKSSAVSKETNAICGIVSAKNAMGGYGNPARFIVTEDQVYLETADKRAAIDYRWIVECPDL